MLPSQTPGTPPLSSSTPVRPLTKPGPSSDENAAASQVLSLRALGNATSGSPSDAARLSLEGLPR